MSFFLYTFVKNIYHEFLDYAFCHAVYAFYHFRHTYSSHSLFLA